MNYEQMNYEQMNYEQMNYEQVRKMQSVIMESPTIKCEKCGCELFEQRTIIKKISLLALGQGTGFTYHPLVVMVCSNCKELSPIDKETLNKNVVNITTEI